VPWLFTGLGRAPFDDPGEGMHAEIARELLGGGDPIQLTLNGVRYVDKPPLLYVLLAGAFALGGATEGTARVVPALGGLAAVAATAWLGARLAGTRIGILAGAALLTSCGFFAYARYVRPETIFLASLAWGFAVLLPAVVGRHRQAASVGLACFGLAALAKDPLGALLPPLAVALALWVSGRAGALGDWLPWPGVVALLGVGFAWYLAVALATPGFVWYTVIDNHVLNVARARHFPDEDVPLGGLEFLAVASFGAAPWVLAAGAACARLARRGAWREPVNAPWVALGIWALGVVGFTALSPFRLPHYGLPAYSAIALLAARGWSESGRPLAVAHGCIFAVAAGACALAWAGGGTAFERVLETTDVATRKAPTGGGGAGLDPALFVPVLGLGALVLGAGAVALGALVAVRRTGLAAAAATAITLLGLMPCVALGLETVAGARAVKPIALELARQAGPDDVVVHEGPIENSGALEWYSGHRPVILDGLRSVLGFGATLPGGRDEFVDRTWVVEQWRRPHRMWLVTGRAEDRSAVAALPEARLVASAGGRRLYVNR
jgi:hypothetical protein